MTDKPLDVPSWTRSPWAKWSWLLVLVVVVAQSLDYHWRALPTSAAGYYARGRADYMQRRYGTAVDNLTKSIAREPKDAGAAPTRAGRRTSGFSRTRSPGQPCPFS